MRGWRRILGRLALLLASVLAIAIPVAAFAFRGNSPESWTVTAACLAVMTSVISAGAARSVLEMQEDARIPNPYPHFDFTSRHQLAMLRVTNSGLSPAHNITLKWDSVLLNSKSEAIGFVSEDGSAGLPVLMPAESIAQIIDTPSSFLKRHPTTEYRGVIGFEDASGRRYQRPFRLDARPYGATPLYDEEAPRTHFELQKVPSELDKIRRAIEGLNK